MAPRAVRDGRAALVIEARNFGESSLDGYGTSCTEAGKIAILAGRTIIGERVWDCMRILDAVLEKFDCICSGHDVKQGKPAPDIYIHAAASVGIPPENCLAIEDSPAGLESAFRAGCMPVLVPDLDGSNEELRKILFAEADTLLELLELL
jgi:hypothetical protein